MKRNSASPLAAILLMAAMPIWSQAPDDKAAIRQTALDYIKDWLDTCVNSG